MRAAARTGGIALLLTLCAVALGACGGDDDNDNASASENSREEAGLRFAECMREHGIDVPDPQPGGGSIELGRSDGPGGDGPDTQGAIGGAPLDLDDPDTQRAMEACQDELGEAAPELSAEDEQEMRDAALRYAQCMREHGIDFPDPQFSEGPGGGLLTRLGGENIDPESPAFREANEACQDELPGPLPDKSPGS
jgi:hypothetical protein